MFTFAILLLTLMRSIMNFLIWHWLSIRFLLLALEKSLKSSICWTTRSNCQNPSSNSVCSTGVCMMSIKPLQKSTGKITLRLYCISWEHLRQFSPQRIRIFLVIALRTMKWQSPIFSIFWPTLRDWFAKMILWLSRNSCILLI